ncbi:MAG: ABC transporter ATP-binding protein, partial [Clostridiaceae bacterium]
MAFFTAEQITYRYPNGLLALDDVSFSMEPGDCVGLIGGNGAGKSTLLSILCGLLLPTSGTVCIDGVSLNKANLALIRNMIGMVFQNPDDQLFMPTVLEDVAFGLQNRGYSIEHIEQKMHQTLEHLNIAHLAERAPYQLSGGEKRSAAIATVLSMDPHMLLFDEPTAFLDPRSKRNLIHLLRAMTAARLVATHDSDRGSRACNRVLVLQKGKLLADDV